MAELKPCPFCGSERTIVAQCRAEHILKKFHGGYYAGCLDCKITTPIQNVIKTRSPILNRAKVEEAKQRAILLWNTRTPQKIEHNSLCETETYKVGELMDYDEEFIQEVEEATEKGLAVPYAIERLLRIIRKKGAEIEHWKAVTKAELDTIHKLGDDYGRVLEGMEECKAIIVQQQAENERLRSVLMEIVGD